MLFSLTCYGEKQTSNDQQNHQLEGGQEGQEGAAALHRLILSAEEI